MSGIQCFPDEVEEASSGMTRDHIEGNKQLPGADEILLMGIENSQIVLRPINAASATFEKPCEANHASISRAVTGTISKRGCEVTIAISSPRLVDDSLQPVQAGHEKILEVKTFQIFQRRGFPQVESPALLG